MNIFIDYELNESGKGKFLQRLIPALRKIDVICRFSPKNADVALHISRIRTKNKLPKVLRMDGVNLLNHERTKWRNHKYYGKAIKSAKAVIYQSAFCQRMLNGVLDCKGRTEHIIHNGADPNDYNVSPIKTDGVRNIIASCKWSDRNGLRPQKRLKQTVEIANAYCEAHKGVIFNICGPVAEPVTTHDRVYMRGNLEESTLRRYLAGADAAVYLASFDWCPNGVIEALAAGVPVLCTNGHGVEELVRAANGGVVMGVEQRWEPRLVKTYEPIRLDVQYVCDQLDKMIKKDIKPNRKAFHIDKVASMYKKVFQSVK